MIEKVSSAKKISSETMAGLETVSDCPFCSSSLSEVAFEEVRDVNYGADDGAFTFLRCKQCGSLYLRERPVGERLQQAYSGYYTREELGASVGPSSVKDRIRTSYINSRYGRSSSLVASAFQLALSLSGKSHLGTDRLYRFAPKAPAKVLDYGCGSGAYLLLLASHGHELHGLEYDPTLIDNLGDQGITVGDVTKTHDGTWDQEFDHISLSHVLEHVPNPNELLSRLFGWLRPGGTLFIELPNGEATGLSIFGEDWSCLEAPRHFTLPSRGALFDAIYRAGFAEIRQYIEPSIRDAMWQSSLSRCEEDRQIAIRSAMANAPPQNEANAEYLTLVARKAATP